MKTEGTCRTLLALEEVSVRYGQVEALTGASMELEPGHICGLVGMNGSGKSTLFKAIMGVVPSSGRILIAGMEPRLARKQGVVSYVPQKEEIDFSFPISVREVVSQGRYGHLGPMRRLRPEDRDAVQRALARVGLEDVADRQIGNLSGGQRKRVFVARGLAQGARLLLLDEPFAGVDKKSELMLLSLFKELKESGVSILISTHDLTNLTSMADSAVLLRQKILLAGSPEEVLAPRNLVLAFGMNPLESSQE